MFLVLLVSFGLIGSLLFTSRSPGVSHPVLRHGITTLQDRLGGTGKAPLLHPLYFSVIALQLDDEPSGNRLDAVAGFAQVFAPDLLVVTGQRVDRQRDALDAALSHLTLYSSSAKRSRAFYSPRVWRHDEHTERTDKDASPWRLRLRFIHPNTTLVVEVADGLASTYQGMADFKSPVLLVSDATSDEGLIASSPPILVDPFGYLHLARATQGSHIFASSHVRPVSASAIESQLLPTEGAHATAVVFELLHS